MDEQQRKEIGFKLLRSFPNSFFNERGEFIAVRRTNLYFMFYSEEASNKCITELDVKCKVLEWLSRDSFKGDGAYIPNHIEYDDYDYDDYNYKLKVKKQEIKQAKSDLLYQNKVRKGINKFLGTNFSRKDMKQIYIPLGNGINHELTIKFIESNYDLNILSK